VQQSGPPVPSFKQQFFICEPLAQQYGPRSDSSNIIIIVIIKIFKIDYANDEV
jgi:hypothetical protein